jgi:hypothetical protein
MLKRISVQQLTVGMYLKEFCGSWMEHPFWRSSFVITDPKDIETVRASSIKEVWIDCGKGVDVSPGEAVVSSAESEAQVDAELAVAAREVRQTERIPSAAEFSRAAKIVARSRQAVTSMFEEARMGKAVDASGARRLTEEISDSVSRNPGALISLARLKTADDYTYMHSVAVCALMVALARQLGLDEEQTRFCRHRRVCCTIWARRVIPIEVLNKPGKLTDDEFAIIKSHPEEGHRLLLQGTGVDAVALDVVLHHHEKTDGSGYPQGLQGRADQPVRQDGRGLRRLRRDHLEPPLQGRLGPRPNRCARWPSGPMVISTPRSSRPLSRALASTRSARWSCSAAVAWAWSPSRADKSLLTPRVKVFFSTRGNARIRPEIIDLARSKSPGSSAVKILQNGSFPTSTRCGRGCRILSAESPAGGRLSNSLRTGSDCMRRHSQRYCAGCMRCNALRLLHPTGFVPICERRGRRCPPCARSAAAAERSKRLQP